MLMLLLFAETFTQDWKDAKRDGREVPVRFRLPESGKGPFPIIVFSHGLGGSREGYDVVGKHWAEKGYAVVHLQHRGSDEEVWKGKKTPLAEMKKAASATNAIARAQDVRFALDQLEKLNKDDPKLKGKLDLDKVGISGHSFGAQTTLMASGMTFGAGKIDEPRFKAAVAMSPAPPARGDLGKAFGSIKIPVYHLTGTKDTSPITDTKPEDRRKPFDHGKGPRWLLILEDGDHMVFGGRKRVVGGKKDAIHHALILESTTLFWDAHLKGDKEAAKKLGEFGKKVGKEGAWEAKP